MAGRQLAPLALSDEERYAFVARENRRTLFRIMH
jgi:hypothetical protein